MKQIIDPFSEVLLALDLIVHRVGSLSLPGSTSLRFPESGPIKFLVLVSGHSCLIVDGSPSTIMLEPGDCAVLPRGAAHLLASGSGPEPADRGPESSNDDPGCFFVGGEFHLMSRHADAMFRCTLPPLIYLRNDVNQRAPMKTLSCLLEEVKHPRPGGDLMAQHLATMMLIQVLRRHISEVAGGSVGWLFALADEAMAAALTHMHESPGYRWSLRELAFHAGLSRSTFAKRFKGTVGVTPMEYLTRWRMILAGARLHSSDEPVSRIASALGYESESAFGRVFRRVMDASPAKYRRGAGLLTGTSKMGPTHPVDDYEGQRLNRAKPSECQPLRPSRKAE